MNVEQLKRIANSRYATIKRLEAKIEELKKDLAQEVTEHIRTMETLRQYAKDLNELQDRRK